MAEQLKVCVDRVLRQDLWRPQDSEAVDGRMRAITPFRNWPRDKAKLKVRFLGGTAAQQATAKREAGWWNDAIGLKLEFGNDPQADIRITFDANDGAWSYVGTDNAGIPFDQPTMNLGFLDAGTAAHEFGHALGLAHEHQNPAGGIEWNEEVVLRELSGPPNNWTEAQIRHNVLNKYRVDQIMGTAFDPKSIMLYFFPGRWVKSGIGTSANTVLSAVDKSFAAGLYPEASAGAVRLEVGAAATAAAITTRGEQDLFTFEVTASGSHVVETAGRTDVVMKLYGPDSSTALIATDDDSGPGLNPRIARSLSVGTYLVQIQHYSRAGTGAYEVKVRRS